MAYQKRVEIFSDRDSTALKKYLEERPDYRRSIWYFVIARGGQVATVGNGIIEEPHTDPDRVQLIELERQHLGDKAPAYAVRRLDERTQLPLDLGQTACLLIAPLALNRTALFEDAGVKPVDLYAEGATEEVAAPAPLESSLAPKAEVA